MVISWDELSSESKNERLKNTSVDELAKTFAPYPQSYFKELKGLLETIPRVKEKAERLKQIIKNEPDKLIMQHRKKLISPEIAILELLDNIFDNYEKNINNKIIDKILEINLVFYFDHTAESYNLLIRENSGGIQIADLGYLLTLGKSNTNSEISKVGTWGEAFLHSITSLGSSATIFSYHPNGKPIEIPIKESFFESETEWRIETSTFDNTADIMNLDKGSTSIIIHKIVSKYNSNEIDQYAALLKLIEETYWYKVNKLRDLAYDVNLTIQRYGLRDLKAMFEYIDFNKVFSHFPYCPPLVLRNYEIDVVKNEKSGKIYVDAYCGLNSSDSSGQEFSHFKGVWMWGNGRMFASELKGINVGFGVEVTGLPTISSRRTAGMLSIYLFFRTDDSIWNEFIPWKIPTKNGYNPENSIQDEILELIKIVSDRFLYPIKTLKGSTLQFKIMSDDFINLSKSEKLEKIYEDQTEKDPMFSDSFRDKSELEVPFSPITELTDESFIRINNYSNHQDLGEENELLIKPLKEYHKSLVKADGKVPLLEIFTETFVASKFLPDVENDEISDSGGNLSAAPVEEEANIVNKGNQSINSIQNQLSKAKEYSTEKTSDLKSKEKNVRVSINIQKSVLDFLKELYSINDSIPGKAIKEVLNAIYLEKSRE